MGAVGAILGLAGTVASLFHKDKKPNTPSPATFGKTPSVAAPKSTLTAAQKAAGNNPGAFSLLGTSPQGILSDAPTARDKLLGS